MKLIKNVIVPVAAILLLAYLGQYIYIVDGHVDWLRLCLVFGIPFGKRQIRGRIEAAPEL